MELPYNADELLRMRLRRGFCLVKMAKATHSGVIELSDRFRPWQPNGDVVTIGPPRLTKTGVPIQPGFCVGDEVLFQPVYGHTFETIEKDAFVLVKQEHIMAVICQ